MLNATNAGNQPATVIFEDASIQLYLEEHPDVKTAYENEVVRPMENGNLPGKLPNTLYNEVKAYCVFLSTGDLVFYQMSSQSKDLRKYFVHLLVPSEEIDKLKAKRLLTKTLSNANELVTSVNQVVKTHKATLLLISVVSAIIRFFTF